MNATGSVQDGGTLLELVDVKKHFPLHRSLAFWREPNAVLAVDGVSLSVKQGTTYGLVGESGSGKSTLAKLVLRLEELSAGRILFEGRDIDGYSRSEAAEYRTKVQTVFQNPKASLNPRMRVFDIVGELPMLHQNAGKKDRRRRVSELLELVGLPAAYIDRFPHELSGGQLQRVAIARAIATNPRMLILDEPVSALDVSIRAQVLNLLSDLQKQFSLTYLLIAHDLAIVQSVSDVIGVLYLGKLVEECSSEALTVRPLHPYTKALLSAVPIPDPSRRSERTPIRGEIGSALNPPKGCRFHPRCPIAVARCSVEEPKLVEIEPGHRVACHLVSGPDSQAQCAAEEAFV
jgi:oligopeptide/dipeptide ABC transporter ATP-binding protein